MITAFVLINSVLCIMLIRQKWKVGSPFFVFFAIILAIVVFPAIFDDIGGLKYYHDFANPIMLDVWTIAESQFIVSLFLIGFIILEVLVPSKKIPSLGAIKIVPRIGILLFAFPALNFIAVLFAYSYFGELLRFANFTEVREMGVLRYLNLIITYLALLSAPLPAFFLFHSRLSLSIFSMISLLIPIVVFGAARQPLIIAVISLSFLAIHSRRHGDIIFAILTVISLPVAEVALEAIKLVRNLPDLGARISGLTDVKLLVSAIDSPGRESSIRYVLYQIVQGVNIERSGEFQYLIRTYLFWLPGFLDIFGIKPSDFEADMFRSIMGGRQGTMHPTVFGSIYADSGWFFAPWIITLFIYMRIFEAFMRRNRLFTVFLFFFSFYPSVMMARGSLYAPVLVTFLTFFVVFLGSIVIRSKT